MDKPAQNQARAQQVARYRSILWSSQGAAALCLFAAMAWPELMPGWLMPIAFILILSQFVVSWTLGRRSVKQIEDNAILLTKARDSRSQIEQLFAMTDMLQSAESHEDAGAVLEATAGTLLPEFRGALYIFNNSRDRLDLACKWPREPESAPAEALVPGNCWALKRGKPHINDPHAGTLCCMHNGGDYSTIEVPMIARGKVHGLLMLATDAPGGTEALQRIERIARALADSMSLALANIALQEKLRTQSLRDPLTGLYNRRYMEDALDRYLNMAERTKSATSVIMVDLDNFKKINDAHGHGKGDTILCDVAAQLVGALRPSDVVSRYGGEEILVILPNCGLDDAMLKAEMLRARIEGLGEAHNLEITASFGVASVPETSNTRGDVVPMADNALYSAKQAGKNCVRSAVRRETEGLPPPRLAAAG
ncbi:MAG TPA: sensor domain-containing diguanylate cyclase [Croceibacterium sp.]|nr:sensor domain-containing diguanylate cyclase [Croceibacterium sp.]